MKYLKTFEKKIKEPYYYSFSEDMRNDNHDIDYFLNLIKTKNVTTDEIERLFYWSCREFPKLAISLVDVMTPRSIQKSIRGIVQLNFDDFKTLIEKKDTYKSLMFQDFFDNIIYYGNDDVKKFELLEKLGVTFNQETLRRACYAGRINIVKYLVGKGFDPNIKKNATFSHAPQNCLDEATSYNKTPEVIKYLVEDLDMPVTYRHMYNVLAQDNLEALPVLVNAKKIIDDYSYSNYATRDENRYAFQFSSLIYYMLNKNQDDLLKILFSKRNDNGYEDLQSLPEKRSFDKAHLNPKYLELAYWIIKNYKGNYSNSASIRFITRNNEDFWFKKMKQDPSIVSKLIEMEDKTTESYKFQKLILDIDEDNVKYIINKLHPKIMDEYTDIPGILDKKVSKYNL